MPLLFVVVCAVMGVVLTAWLVRMAYRDKKAQRKEDERWARLSQKIVREHQEARERAVFDAMARGRR